MNAIVALTRGYNNLADYAMLIERNLHIKRSIIDKFNPECEIVLFHQGNITELAQQHIIKQSEIQLKFVDVSDCWNNNIDGYKQMCRFNIYDIWELCKEYNLILRIDEDCWVTACEHDPFSLIGQNVLLRSAFWGESHPETNATFPPFLINLLNLPDASFYNHRFPYTNVFLSRVDFWCIPELNKILKTIAFSPGQIANRWGDLPVLGSLLNIFAANKIGKLEGMIYKHLSHGTTIDCSN